MASVSRFIYLLQKIEAAYPELTTFQLLNNIRYYFADSLPFQILLGTILLPGQKIIPRGSLTKAEIDEFIGEITHGVKDGKETGISLDTSTNRQVALGNVITGIAGGLSASSERNFSESVNLVGFILQMTAIEIVPAQVVTYELVKARCSIDVLYAMTICGDLGQTVTPPAYRTLTAPFGGVGTEATSAELHGDIDGFMLGYWLASTSSGKDVRTAMFQGSSVKLSTMLAQYYRTRIDKPIYMRSGGAGDDLEAIRRFANFNFTFTALREIFIIQTVAFQTWYAIQAKTLPNETDSAKVLWDFEQWCRRGGK
jgi:hypothetical protein